MSERLVSGLFLLVVFLFMLVECISNPDLVLYLEYVKSVPFDEYREPCVFWGVGSLFGFLLGNFVGTFIPFSKKKQDP